MAKSKGTAGRGEARERLPEQPAPPPREVGKGRIVAAYGADPSKKYNLRYELRELNDLVTSNTDTGEVNPAYPSELQPRDRTRAASRQQIINMAQGIVPEAYTTEFRSLDRGAPIIGPDGVVESGNGRTMALRAATRDNAEGYAAYKEAVKAAAREKGIRPSDVDKFQNPVLVRVRVDNVNRVEFARDANTATTLGMSDTEKSKTDASRIRTRDLLTFDSSDDFDADLRRPTNREFVRGFVATLPEGERATVMDRSGELTQSGTRRIKAAMFSRVYDDARLTDKAFESQDNDTKNITTGMLGSLGRIAAAEERVKSGQRAKDLAISSDIAAAAGKLQSLKQSGLAYEHYMGQSGLFGDDITPDQKRILGALYERRRSAKQVSEFIGSWADIVESQPDPNQASMFGGAGESRSSLFDRWLSGQTAKKQDGLF